jgi:hypothetical protein
MILATLGHRCPTWIAGLDFLEGNQSDENLLHERTDLKKSAMKMTGADASTG